MLDTFYIHRSGADEIQLDLILDHRTNVELYPTLQSYFWKNQPPVFAVWGKHDASFLPTGVQAYKKDVPHVEVHLLDAGQFALETQNREIANIMREFLHRKIDNPV